jgi:hypothetical protein
VARAEDGLRALFPFDGRGYTDTAALLERERPDIVDVCSPPEHHAEHVRLALEAGCDVLCEKPFVWREDASTEDAMAEARALVSCAESRGRTLALCAQYAAGVRVFQDLWEARANGSPLESFEMHLEVPSRGRSTDPRRVWADLGPHPLSAAQALFPGASIDWDGLAVACRECEVSARFTLADPAGRRLACELLTRNSQEYLRELRLNGYPFRVDGATGDDGVYCASVSTPDGEFRTPDFMHATIRAFLAGKPIMGPREALVNNEWLLRISERCAASR